LTIFDQEPYVTITSCDADPVVQRGPGQGGDVCRGGRRAAGQKETGPEDQQHLGRSRAQDQVETRCLGGACSGAEVVQGRPNSSSFIPSLSASRMLRSKMCSHQSDRKKIRDARFTACPTAGAS
jgi:hypothetical protein